MFARPLSFLGRRLGPSWIEEAACILTMPTYDFATSTHVGAAYRHNGSLILESLRPARLGHWRHVDPVSISPIDYPWTLPGLDTAIYGGHFFSMWGHFLFETIGTAALADALPQCPVVFSPFAPGGEAEFLASWESYKPILSAAGWGERRLGCICISIIGRRGMRRLGGWWRRGRYGKR